MDDPLHAELAGALSSAAKDEHERKEQDEQAQAFAVLGDVLTTRDYEAWRRDQHADDGGRVRNPQTRYEKTAG